MVTATISQKMRFLSRSLEHHPALLPIKVAICLIGFIIALALVMAGFIIQSEFDVGLTMIAVSLGLAALSFYAFNRWLNQINQKYELYIDGDFISLSAIDEATGSLKRSSIHLPDVESAEYFPARDTASILLRGKPKELNIPLWAFGPDAEEKIVSYLRGRGIEVFALPSDVVL